MNYIVIALGAILVALGSFILVKNNKCQIAVFTPIVAFCMIGLPYGINSIVLNTVSLTIMVILAICLIVPRVQIDYKREMPKIVLCVIACGVLGFLGKELASTSGILLIVLYIILCKGKVEFKLSEYSLLQITGVYLIITELNDLNKIQAILVVSIVSIVPILFVLGMKKSMLAGNGIISMISLLVGLTSVLAPCPADITTFLCYIGLVLAVIINLIGGYLRTK